MNQPFFLLERHCTSHFVSKKNSINWIHSWANIFVCIYVRKKFTMSSSSFACLASGLGFNLCLFIDLDIKITFWLSSIFVHNTIILMILQWQILEAPSNFSKQLKLVIFLLWFDSCHIFAVITLLSYFCCDYTLYQ